MKVKIIPEGQKIKGTILIPVYETYHKNLVPVSFGDTSVSAAVFYGKKDTHYITESNDTIYVFVGIGKTTDYKSLKTVFRRISAKQQDHFSKNVSLVIPDNFTEFDVEAAVSGLYLGTYDIGHFKKKEPHLFTTSGFELQIISNANYQSVAENAVKIAQSQLETMHLVDAPPNVATPKYLANWAVKSGKKHGFDVKILGKKDCEQQKLDAFLAVGKGSENEPQFIIMNYLPENTTAKTKHIGVVGKGITFDTGGLNIKVAGMYNMKCDMAGGAAVLGAMQLIADLKLPVKVTAIVPACESVVDAKSFLPSDVINSYAGHSIEIIDTDAEGRLILADGLSYLIKNYKPETIVDLATLTGSAVGTFGYECAALFTNNDEISKKLQQSGDAIGERCWPLPLWDAYKSDIESDIANVKNWSGKPIAGAITAAKFLEYFTEDHKSWAHLDIAGVAFGDDEFAKSKHATAYGVHLLIKFIENL